MAKIPDLLDTEKKIRGLYDDLFGAVTADIQSRVSSASSKKNAAPSTEKPQTPLRPCMDEAEINSILNDLNQNIIQDFSSLDAEKKTTVSSPEAQAAAEIEKPVEPETDPMDDLNALVGLADLKKDVEELISLAKMQKMRKDQGLKSVPVSLHLVFSGNPGTGKTTVARILARLYKKIGVLSKGQLVEVDRSSLVAGYVGQTATKTMEKIKEAMGGVLFIDEAYTLVKEGGNDFGQEAIDTILKAMEDHRDDFVVIVAGYTELMKQFVNSNPGLKSRFNKYLFFPDYSMEELFSIFQGFCTKYEYKLDEAATKAARSAIQKLIDEKSENFANAREVRNLFEKIITRQATRISKLADGENPPEITVILAEDVTGEAPEKASDDSSDQIPEKEDSVSKTAEE